MSSTSVESLKAELKSIKTSLDAITSRPEFGAAMYQYGKDPIYLQTNECPAPFTACDASVMDCPDDKYGQPEMYTAGGQRCYRSGSLARAAFEQYRERLQSDAASPQTLVAQIRELVKSASRLSSELQGEKGRGAAAQGAPGAPVCEDVDAAHGYADLKQRQQYCENLADSTGVKLCNYDVTSARCTRKTEKAIVELRKDNERAKTDGLTRLQRAIAFVTGGGAERASRSALKEVEKEEAETKKTVKDATDKLLQETVNKQGAAPGIAGVLASMLTTMANDKDDSGNPTKLAGKAQTVIEWCENHALLVNLAGVGLVAGVAFLALPPEQLLPLTKAATVMVDSLTKVQGVFLSAALNGLNAVWQGVTSSSYLTLVKDAVTSGAGFITPSVAALAKQAVGALGLAGGAQTDDVEYMSLGRLFKEKQEEPLIEVELSNLFEEKLSAEEQKLLDEFADEAGISFTKADFARLVTASTLAAFGAVNVLETSLTGALASALGPATVAAVTPFLVPGFQIIALALVGPTLYKSIKTTELFKKVTKTASSIVDNIKQKGVNVLGTVFAVGSDIFNASASLASKVASAAGLVSAETAAAVEDAPKATAAVSAAAATGFGAVVSTIGSGMTSLVGAAKEGAQVLYAKAKEAVVGDDAIYEAEKHYNTVLKTRNKFMDTVNTSQREVNRLAQKANEAELKSDQAELKLTQVKKILEDRPDDERVQNAVKKATAAAGEAAKIKNKSAKAYRTAKYQHQQNEKSLEDFNQRILDASSKLAVLRTQQGQPAAAVAATAEERRGQPAAEEDAALEAEVEKFSGKALAAAQAAQAAQAEQRVRRRTTGKTEG